MGEDHRRAAPRFDVAVQAEVFTGEDLMFATTRNLSSGGVGLVCDRQLAPGSLVGLNLFLVVDGIEDALSSQLAVEGKVAWCTESQTQKGSWLAGIKFEKMDDDRRLLVDRFLCSLKPA